MGANTVEVSSSPDLLYSELEKLKNDNIGKKREISSLRSEIETLLKERDLLNAEVKKIADDVKQLRNKRDSLNSKVKECKIKRDELRVAATKKRQALSQLLEQAQKSSGKAPGNMSDLTKQITRLEWEIQTNPLDPKTERNMITKIAELEKNLTKHKVLKGVRDRLLRLRMEVGTLRIQAQSTHQELTKYAEESEIAHKEMVEKVRLLSEKKKAADGKHGAFLEKNKQRIETITTLRNNLSRIELVRNQIGNIKTSGKTDKAEKVKSQYKEAAEEKIRTGGKLSFEEFQALMSDTVTEGEED
ncbi:MAG TPA: hypothetical protein VK503_06515 [Candidatus Bathyarchaeia archaeon]|nr:hypothetical protein [Candidatus Bathyarchaeia archaeon]